MKIRDIPLGDIVVKDRLRGCDKDWVRALVASIEEIGLQQPLAVVPLKDGKYRLVSGRHRLQAASRLKWYSVPCVVMNLNQVDRDLAEVDENLVRRQFDYLDFCRALDTRKTLYEAKHPEAKNGGDRKSDDYRKNQSEILSFRSESAAKVGLSERSIELAVQVARAIDPAQANKLRSAGLADSQKDLLTLAKMGPEDRKKAVALIESGKAENAATASAIIKGKPAKPQVSDDELKLLKLQDAWNRASVKTRERFLEWVEEQKAGDGQQKTQKEPKR